MAKPRGYNAIKAIPLIVFTILNNHKTVPEERVLILYNKKYITYLSLTPAGGGSAA